MHNSFQIPDLAELLKLKSNTFFVVPSVAEWSKAPESDASAGGESPVRAPVRAATLCPYA